MENPGTSPKKQRQKWWKNLNESFGIMELSKKNPSNRIWPDHEATNQPTNQPTNQATA